MKCDLYDNNFKENIILKFSKKKEILSIDYKFPKSKNFDCIVSNVILK
jgi:hypothetical protein